MGFSHLDKNGKAKMVDVSKKKTTKRTALASGDVLVSAKLLEMIEKNTVEKGDVLTVAKIAAIQAAKNTAGIIPLCHNIFISHIDVTFEIIKKDSIIRIFANAKSTSLTGLEMESLTAVSVAALTIYDMCKAVDKSIVISNIHLCKKTGGKSGTYVSPGKK